MDDDFHDAAIHPLRLAVLVACSSSSKSLDDLGLSARDGRRHLGRLERAGLMARDGDRWVATSDWRPLIEALSEMQRKHDISDETD